MTAGPTEEVHAPVRQRAARPVREGAGVASSTSGRQEVAPKVPTPAAAARRPGAQWLDRLKRLAVQALRVDPIRTRVARARFLYYVKLLKRLRTFDANSDGITENTIAHNVKGMVDLT